jgi:uncharacterized membrane protein
MEVTSLKKKMSLKKILRLFHSYDEDFIVEWSETIKKGLFKYFIKMIIIYAVLFVILGLFFIIEKYSFYGYKQGYILPFALIIGVINGVIFSIISSFLNNRRYEDFKKKKLESDNINNNEP